MTPEQEAAQILTRVFEALARANGKTLNKRTRSDIARACELLVSASGQYTELLDDLPTAARMSPAEAVVNAAEHDPNYQEWRRRRAEVDNR